MTTEVPLRSPYLLGMLHLAGTDRRDVVRRAVREAGIYRDAGLDGCIVENYFGSAEDVVAVLDEFASRDPGLAVGVNLLDDDTRGFALATAYETPFIQIDSVAGHLTPDDDDAFARNLARWRSAYSGWVLGGVRFKYQPVLSGNDLATDLRVGAGRCDAIVVSGDRTGAEPPIAKIEEFAGILDGRTPLVVGSGMTPENARGLLRRCAGAIVGSSLKVDGVDRGDVDPGRVRDLVKVVRS